MVNGRVAQRRSVWCNPDAGSKGKVMHVARSVRCGLGVWVSMVLLAATVIAQETVRFPDDGLEGAIRDAIFKAYGTLYDYDVSWLTVLDASHGRIGDLPEGTCRGSTS